ncbi:MAG: subclass B3 metallo-beta-lactamase [Acidobacteriia bacterium]|nr:subclass B3 metallo-beta-lactamase [Terriglobia bacterium]
MMPRKSLAAQAMRAALAVAIVVAIPVLAHAQAGAPPANAPAPGAAAPNMAQMTASMKEAFAPFHIIGNINYVGSKGLAIYLITTPAGAILLDTGYPDMAPQIEANIKTLGYKLSDVKILIDSHSHIDHAGGVAELKSATGARLMALAEDAPYLESGGHNDVLFGDRNLFPPAKVDRILHDGDAVTLGGVTLVPHLTAGHTPGNTTWTMVTEDKGKKLNVVFFGMISVMPNADLNGSPAYPNIGADYAHTMKVIPALPCDVFLGSNASFFNLEQKHDALAKGADPNPFIDPAGCKAFVDRTEASYQQALARQKAGAAVAPAAPGGMTVK